MQRTSFREMNCSIAQCLEVVGEWWSMLIVRDLFLGITRFEDFHQRLGISRNILNQRLEHLIERGVVDRVPYCEHPVRYDYRLTEKGKDLWLILTAMRQWGDRWEAPEGAPLELVHTDCDHVAQVVGACSVCGERVSRRDLRAVAGPGLRASSGERADGAPVGARSGRPGRPGLTVLPPADGSDRGDEDRRGQHHPDQQPK